MVDSLLLRHAVLSLWRLSAALIVLAALAATGGAVRRLLERRTSSGRESDVRDGGDAGARSESAEAWNRAEGLVLATAAGVGALSLLYRTLAGLGLAHGGTIWLATLAAPAVALASRLSRSSPLARLHALLGDALAAARSGLGALALLALALPTLPMAFAPAVSYDALVYHLRIPELALLSGRWPVDPAQIMFSFPGAVETLALPALAADGSGVAAQLIGLGLAALALVALGTLARRLAGGSGSAAAIAPLLFLALPAVAVQAPWAWSDLPLTLALAATALAILRREIALAGLLLGLAAAIKYTALPIGLPLLAWLAVVAVRERAVRTLGAGLAAGTLVALPWYLANFLRTGNPFHPFLGRLFGDAAAASSLAAWSHAALPSPWPPLLAPFLAPEAIDSDIGGPLALALFGGTLATALLRSGRRGAAIVTLGVFGALLPVAPLGRYLLPGLAGLAVLAAAELGDLRRGRGGRAAAACAIAAFAFRGGASTAGHNALFFNPLPAAVGLEREDDYRDRAVVAYPLFRRAGALPLDARVMVLGEPRLFRFPRATTSASQVSAPAIRPYLQRTRTAPELAAALRRDGVSHLLVQLTFLRDAGGASGVPEALLTPLEAARVRELLERSTPLDREGTLLLIALPTAPAR